MAVVELLVFAADAIFHGAILGGEIVLDKVTDKKKKKAAKEGFMDELEMWESSLTQAISAKAKGVEVPDKAIEHIRLNTIKANLILHEAQRTALRLYVRKNKNHADYNAELANIFVQHITIQSPATVSARISILADIFRYRTSDEEYREALIKSVVSYSIHKTKVLAPKEKEIASKPTEQKPLEE